MSRWLLVLIALLLPLQLAWASVGEYCGDAHEAPAVHAVHLHTDGVHVDADADEGSEPDCGQCHGHFVAMPLHAAPQGAVCAPRATAQAPARRLVPLLSARPERPQWPPLA